MRSRTESHRPVAATLAALALGVLALAPLAGCDDDGTPTEQDPSAALPADELLRIGSESISREEFEALEAYFRRVQPELGVRTLRRNLLDLHFLPMLADRLFHTENRERTRASAESLRVVAPTASQLRRRVADLDIEPEWVGWTDLPFAAREYVCDELSIGSTSPVIEAPGAFYVIGVLDVERGLVRKSDRAQVVLRRFPIPPSESGPKSIEAARISLNELPLTSAPDIRDALPRWLNDA